MKNEKLNNKSNIVERTVAYSLQIITLFRELEHDTAGKIIGRQLLRSGTSIGANVHEAQGGQSKADFIAKMSIAHKEAYETTYWLRIITETKLIAPDKLELLVDETRQIVKILSAILLTAKKNKT